MFFYIEEAVYIIRISHIYSREYIIREGRADVGRIHDDDPSLLVYFLKEQQSTTKY